MTAGGSKVLSVASIVTTLTVLAGCTQSVDALTTTSSTTRSYAYTSKDQACLERAMFFEANRSSRDGLIAVGTVVMNRVDSDKFPDTVCGVVGQKGQFAPGVLSRSMNSKALPDVQSAAEAVLKGERHPGVEDAMFFHTAGLTFPYKNMHYVLVAGGNAFYEKRSRDKVTKPVAPPPIEQIAATTPHPAPRPSALSYEGEPDAADTIGAMILKENEPRSE